MWDGFADEGERGRRRMAEYMKGQMGGEVKVGWWHESVRMGGMGVLYREERRERTRER